MLVLLHYTFCSPSVDRCWIHIHSDWKKALFREFGNLWAWMATSVLCRLTTMLIESRKSCVHWFWESLSSKPADHWFNKCLETTCNKCLETICIDYVNWVLWNWKAMLPINVENPLPITILKLMFPLSLKSINFGILMSFESGKPLSESRRLCEHLAWRHPLKKNLCGYV